LRRITLDLAAVRVQAIGDNWQCTADPAAGCHT
jgi:hypothetical protein